MKFRPVVLFITVLGTALSLMSAATPPKKTVPKKKASTTKAVTKTAGTTRPTVAHKTTISKTPAKTTTTKNGARRAPVVRRAASQAAPTPERYREIQSALAEKGYLKSEPNGVWDADSVDAMKRYQADQKQDPSGKITAASIIGLGLGPSTASSPVSAQAAK
jgi:putative peptidoglycan binding protein